MKRFALIVMALLLWAGAAEAKDGQKDRLVIGITQFPSTFHPNIDSMLAKTYILSA
ncbi:MAG: hypothetical protein HOF23_09330, partial [Rhodospirillaceae bacterium]|nr:hypothetical protein [Rhodospirillaceae bacterium]